MMPFPDKQLHLHFVGVGGCGMSGVAWVLHQRGYRISGSDLNANAMTRRLQQHGAAIYQGHQAANVGESVGALIISSAIKETNPELLEARRRGIPVLHRADGLKHILESGDAVAVAGTHGKTTTTSMLALAAEKSGLDPTILIGGELNDIGGNAKVGASRLIIAESDESDGSFLKYAPTWSIVTNIEPDHMEYYQNTERLRAAFSRFIAQTRECAVLCIDDPNLPRIARECGVAHMTYSIRQPAADYFAAGIEETCDGIAYELHTNGKARGRVRLGVAGLHNAANSLAALCICELIGAEPARAIAALEQFRGVQRRFQIKGEARGIVVADDYAHHPTEVAATLDSARSWVRTHAGKRVIGVFQPHRYSRTQHLGSLFGGAFSHAEEVVITDVYGAGEAPIAGIDGRTVYDSIVAAGHPHARYIASKELVAEFLQDQLRAGDLVLTMGAGDIWEVGEELLARLGAQGPQLAAI